MVRRNIVLTLILILVLSFSIPLGGCNKNGDNKVMVVGAGGELREPTTWDEAAILSREFSKNYKFLHSKVKFILENGTEEQKAWMIKHVTVPMDKAKNALIAYNSAVILWKSTGNMPNDLFEQEAIFRDGIESIMALFISKGGD